MNDSYPSIIYKYEDFTVQSLRNLKTQTIYFGSPQNFNDPYDCALRPNFAVPTDEQIEQVRRHYLARFNLPEQGREELEHLSCEQLRELVVRSARKVAENYAENFLSEKGVSCFSEIHHDLLMWSHYGGRYKGFCLEFATDYEPFHKLREVKYVEQIPRIDPITIILQDRYDDYLNLFCTKSINWSYEREWRAIHHVAGIAFTYPSEALRGVYFGPDIDTDCMEIVCLILSGQNPNVRFWQGLRSEEHFKVEFEHFTYTSHLDAKRRGLK